VSYCSYCGEHTRVVFHIVSYGNVLKDWKKRAELKINFYDCITLFYLGLCSEEQQKWGERVTYCQAAVDRLNESMHLVNKSDNDAAAITESLRFAMDVAGGK